MLSDLSTKPLSSYRGDYAVSTHTGIKRRVNEDAISAKPEMGLWLVADGMGGHKCGAAASAIAKSTIVECIGQGNGLVEAIQVAHDTIIRKAGESDDFHGMGSTVVAVLLNGKKYSVAWVGDSRAYLWDDRLTQITHDHSYVRSLMDMGAITQEEADVHPSRHFITRCLGIDDEGSKLEVDIQQDNFSVGQELLLCSDGLTDELTDLEIEEILSVNTSAQDRVDRLVEMAIKNGGNDNISVILLSAPENIQDSVIQSKEANVNETMKIIKQISIGALLAISTLGLILYLNKQGLF